MIKGMECKVIDCKVMDRETWRWRRERLGVTIIMNEKQREKNSLTLLEAFLFFIIFFK